MAEAWRHLPQATPGDSRSFAPRRPGVAALPTLHDADLVTLNLAKVRGRSNLFMSFQLADGDAGVQLRYDGLKGLKVVSHEPNIYKSPKLFALYNEFDVSPGGTVTHSILMTAGIEIRVQFAKLFITRFTKLVVPGRGRSAIKDQLAAMAGAG